MFALNVSRIGVVFWNIFIWNEQLNKWFVYHISCMLPHSAAQRQRNAHAPEGMKSSIFSKPHLVIDHEVVYDWPITKQRWIRPTFEAFYIGILNTNHVSKFSKKSVMMFSQAALLIFLSPVVLSSRRHAYIILTLKPHFYIVKLGFTGVYIIFTFLLKT